MYHHISRYYLCSFSSFFVKTYDIYFLGWECYHRSKFQVKSPQIFQWRFNSLNLIPVFRVPPCVMHCMPYFLIFFILVMFSLWIFPQDGGLSAPQRSRVGSLRPISTHTVARGMIWNLALLKPERVSYCKLLAIEMHIPKHSLTHSAKQPHTDTTHVLGPQTLICDKMEQTHLLSCCRPALTSLASGWSERLSLYVCHHKQSIDSVLCKQQGEVPGETRAQTLQWCAVHNNALSRGDAVRY